MKKYAAPLSSKQIDILIYSFRNKDLKRGPMPPRLAAQKVFEAQRPGSIMKGRISLRVLLRQAGSTTGLSLLPVLGST
jgi:hypothetical protein